MSEFFTEIPPEEAPRIEPGLLIDALSDVEKLMDTAPDYYGPRFQAIAELRASDDGSLHKGNEFRRVASLVNVPLTLAIKMAEPNFFKDKKGFYRWLTGKGARYKTYETKGGSRPTTTFVDGQAVVW